MNKLGRDNSDAPVDQSPNVLGKAELTSSPEIKSMQPVEQEELVEINEKQNCSSKLRENSRLCLIVDCFFFYNVLGFIYSPEPKILNGHDSCRTQKES